MKKEVKRQENTVGKKEWLYWLPVILVLLVLPLITKYCIYESRFYLQGLFIQHSNQPEQLQ